MAWSPRSVAERMRRRRLARQLFLEGWPLTKIAEAVGVHRKTLWHWRRTDGWDAELQALMDRLEAEEAILQSPAGRKHPTRRAE